MANADLATFDPSRLADAMKDKIRLELLGVIPPEMWKQMIEKAIQDFVTDMPGTWRADWGRYDKPPVPSPLSLLIKAEIEVVMKKEIEKYLASDVWKGEWVNGKTTITEHVQKIVQESAPAILTTMVSSIAQQVVQNFMAQASQHRSY